MTAENQVTRWLLKIVPDAEPNADGEWIDADVPVQFEEDVYSFIPRKGWHVVQKAAPKYPRD